MVVVILAATNPDTSAMTWTYVASAVGFAVALVVVCAVVVWLLDRAATRRFRRHVNRVTSRGDAQVLRAVEQREQARRERVTVPRALTERPHR